MKKSLAAAVSLTSAGIVLAGVAGTASAATHTSVRFSKPVVSVHGNSHSYETVTMRFAQCVAQAGIVATPATSTEPGGIAEGHRVGPRTFSARITLAADSHPGRWYVSVLALPCSEDADPIEMEDVATFTVKRETHFAGGSTSARNVQRHHRVTFAGNLRLTTPSAAAPTGYTGAGKAAVDVQFRAAHSRTYRHVTTVHTDAHGHFATGVAVNRTGYFRAVYRGTAVNAGSHGAAHYVHVR